MSLICKRFEKGERPYTAESLAHKHNIPIRMTKQILYELVDLRLLYECNTDKDEPTFYTPSEDINHLNVATLMTRLDSAGNENFKIDKENKYERPWQTLEDAKNNYFKDVSHVLLKDL